MQLFTQDFRVHVPLLGNDVASARIAPQGVRNAAGPHNVT